MGAAIAPHAVGAALALSSAAAFSPTTIRVTLQLPGKHSLGQNWLAFKKIVETESNGELKIQLFPSAQLHKDKQAPGAAGSGAVEAGSAFLGRFSGFQKLSAYLRHLGFCDLDHICHPPGCHMCCRDLFEPG